MFDFSVVADLKTVLGWKDFWDLTEIPTLGSPLNDTLTGEYYQDFSGALRLDYITSLLPPNRTLVEYLDTVETESITQVLNTIVQDKEIGNYGKDIATNDVIYNVGRHTADIINESRFCGVMMEVKDSTGIRATINRIGLYLTSAVTDLDLYLFHSSQSTSVATFQFTTTKTNSFSWQEIRRTLDYDDGAITGGTWYIGYYQDDLATQSSQAVQYSAINWLNGYCNQCGNAAKQNDISYKSIRNRLFMQGFYVPSASLPAVGTMFDPIVAVKTNSNNWGFNFNITIGCNLTQFWKDNKRTLKNSIGLKVAMNVLEMMKYSSEINNVEEAVKIMIIRDLEGAEDTKNKPLWLKAHIAIKALNLDQSNLNSDCLPCARKPRTRYGAIG